MNSEAETPESESVTQQDYASLAAFRHALREFLHFSEEAAASAGLPPHQHQAMLVIKGMAREGRISVGDLALHLRIRHQSAVGLVQRMVARSLVGKSADPSDHRHMLIRLTADGERILERLSAAHKAELARLGPALQATLSQLETIT